MKARQTHDMVIIYLAPLVMLVGLVMFFAVKNNADLKRIGEHMFWCGLLATLLAVGLGRAFHLP